MSISIENSCLTSQTYLLANIWEYAVNEHYAIAIWRHPKQNKFNFLADFSGKPKQQKIDFESETSGFCISTFLNNWGQNSHLLKNDIHLEFDVNNYLLDQENQSVNSNLFLKKVKNFNVKKARKIQFSNSNSTISSEKLQFEKIVEKGIEKINQGEFQKVVLSRRKKIEFEGDFNIIKVINQLSAAYPNAFISAVYLPENNEIWLGASPELLVSIDEKGLFKTMALAGTQNAFDEKGQKIGSANARWSQKEIEEQAFVSRYIIDCFKKVRVREYIENGPKTVEAGNLLHLQTTYSVDTKSIEFNQFATVMLELLHPTSAVCGMPKAITQQFILENEGYQREYYSGFLGPKNIKNESSLYVNLRSLKINENTIHLFAGAGITEDSNPSREWFETEMKMETLLKIIIETPDKLN